MNKSESTKYKKQIKLCQEFIARVQLKLKQWENEKPDWGRLIVLKSQEHDLANLVFNMEGLTKEEQRKYGI